MEQLTSPKTECSKVGSHLYWHSATTGQTTVFPLIEAGSQIQVGGQTSVVLIEAGSLIQAGSLTEAGGLKANIVELIAHPPIALWCIASFVRIMWLAERRYGLPGISLYSNKYKTKNLGVINNVMFIGEPGGSNRSWVSNRSRGSVTIVLIEAGGFY